MRYYAVSKGSDLICLIPVSPDGTGKSMGCGHVRGFEGHGLRVGLNGESDEGRLIVPNTGQIAVSKDPSDTWVEVADDFLVKEASR